MTTVSDLGYFLKKYQDLFNTLLLYIPLLALTDGQNHRRRLKYTRCAWAGGTGSEYIVSHK